MAKALALLFFLLFLIGGSDAVWCVCKSDQPTSALQKTIDYACGAGADCTPILQNGACYNPNTVVAHCSYAANSYFQRNGQAQTACNFSETCTMSTTDPSYSGCSYPSTATAAGTSGTPTSGTPTSTTGTPTSFTPAGTTSGGIMSGLGPTGTTSYDTSGIDSSYHPNAQLAIFLFSIIFSLALAVV